MGEANVSEAEERQKEQHAHMKPKPKFQALSLTCIENRRLDEDYARLSREDTAYLEKLHAEPLIGSWSIEQERERMRRGQTSCTEDYAVRVDTYRTAACPVHILRPLGALGLLPITFFFHGGGWTLGDLRTHAKLVCELAIRSQSAVVFLEYPLAPEHPFPIPLESCITAISEILQSALSLRLDSNRCGFVGDSSGGNLCLAYSLMAQKQALFLPHTQVLLYPAVDASLSQPSHLHFAENPNLGRQTMEWFWSNYVAEAALRETALVSPLNGDQEAFSGFPPTLIISCEHDILRDEAEQMAARLVKAGVEVIAVRWLGALHGFVVNEALSRSASARACVNFVAQHLVSVYRGGY